MILSRANTPEEVLLKIIREKHEQIPSIMKENEIDCWMIFVRETESNPDPIMDLVVGGDVVWDSAFIFTNKNDEFSKVAIVGNFDAPAEKKKEIWDRVIPYTEGMADILRNLVDDVNPDK